MKPLAIDFARRRGTSSRWQAALLIGALLTASAAWAGWVLAEKRAALAQVSAPLEAEATPELPAWNDEQTKALNEAVQALNFAWPVLMTHLEQAMTPGASLLSLDVSTQTHDVKLTAEAPGTNEMMGFIDGLKRDPLLSGLRLTRQEAARSEGTGGLQFTLEGRVPDAALRPTLP